MGVCRNPSTSTVFAKLVNPLLCLVIIFFILYVGREILIPFSFSCLLALLLISPCRFFKRQVCPRGISSLISLLRALMVFLVVFYFISNSLLGFKKDLPLMIENLNESLNHLEHSIQKQFHLSTSKMQEFV